MGTKKRKICVFSGSRAEYGLLKPLMDEIKRDRDLKLQLIVSGMHLSREHGLTYKYIEADGFVIDAKFKMLHGSNTDEGISRSVAAGIVGMNKALKDLEPESVVLLGDRFETMAVATACLIARVPIVHIHGGETTLGAIDEAIRHAITKMSQLHFTSCEAYRKRVIQLGENPKRCFNVGALGIDNIKKMKLLSRKSLEDDLQFQFNKKNLLVTFHPVTLEKYSSQLHFKNLLSALKSLKDTMIIFTRANADMEGRVINAMIDEFVVSNPQSSVVFTSMGQLRYLSAIKHVDGVIGNSSSGIIEAPSFKVGTINIGDRQTGRIKAASVIDCAPTQESIKQAIQKLFSPRFQKSLKSVENPYGKGTAAKKIVSVLKKKDLKGILKKEFFDIHVN